MIENKKIDFIIDEFKALKKQPKEIFYKGDLSLLNRRKISIVGTRKPSQYTKKFIFELSQKLSKNNFIIISGGAMGVDTVAHKSAFPNTIFIAASGLDIIYPQINKDLIKNIYQNSLAISEYKYNYNIQKWSFLERNRLVVALGEILIIGEADKESGSMRSYEFAEKMGKKIFVLPHRLGESTGTNWLLNEGLATAIYNIDDFINSLGGEKIENKIELEDDFLIFCRNNPNYDEIVAKYPTETFEYELDGKIEIENNIVKIII